MGKDDVASGTKRCFVVMGFGIKTDFATGRKLDLNKSYRLLIKPVVEEKGLVCVRADEISHSGSIDARMYQELLSADVVIADLSTANLNAMYELGIRHALRPRTTIVISEDKLTYPFDLNHVNITSYTHLGDAIDFEEVERFRAKLGTTLQAVLDGEQPDSPVYTYLNQLIPPSLKEQAVEALEQMAAETEAAREEEDDSEDKKPLKRAANKTLGLLAEQGELAIKQRNYSKAKALFSSALLIGKTQGDVASNDSYLVHRLALATYKAEEPDTLSALKEAMALLHQLDLNHTNDPETVALAGAIEKRLFEKGQGEEHLSAGILYYQRGFYLLHNRYNGINLAFLLNCKANSSLSTLEDKIADRVYANRARRDVLAMCERDLNQILAREQRAPKATGKDELSNNQLETDTEQKFWIYANKAEAHLGLGETAAYISAYEAAKAVPHEKWMMEALDYQISSLVRLIESNGQQANAPLADATVN